MLRPGSAGPVGVGPFGTGTGGLRLGDFQFGAGGRRDERKHTIDIGGTPTRTEWFVLAVLLMVLPVAALVGWSVSRLPTARAAGAASTVAVLVTVASGFYGGMTAQ